MNIQSFVPSYLIREVELVCDITSIRPNLHLCETLQHTKRFRIASEASRAPHYMVFKASDSIIPIARQSPSLSIIESMLIIKRFQMPDYSFCFLHTTFEPFIMVLDFALLSQADYLRSQGVQS
jgi:hypothetical protein